MKKVILSVLLLFATFTGVSHAGEWWEQLSNYGESDWQRQDVPGFPMASRWFSNDETFMMKYDGNGEGVLLQNRNTGESWHFPNYQFDDNPGQYNWYADGTWGGDDLHTVNLPQADFINSIFTTLIQSAVLVIGAIIATCLGIYILHAAIKRFLGFWAGSPFKPIANRASTIVGNYAASGLDSGRGRLGTFENAFEHDPTYVDILTKDRDTFDRDHNPRGWVRKRLGGEGDRTIDSPTGPQPSKRSTPFKARDY